MGEGGGGAKKKNPAYIFSSATIATLDIVSAICKKASHHSDTNHPGCVIDHVSWLSMSPHYGLKFRNLLRGVRLLDHCEASYHLDVRRCAGEE